MVLYSNKMRETVLGLLLVIVSGTAIYAGGPWPQMKGHGYFKLAEWWTVFDQHYTDAGMVDPNVTTGIFNTLFYGEYGITDRLTATVSGPVFSRNYMNNLKSRTTEEIIVPGEAINGVGDINLGIKYGLTKPGSKYPVSISLILGLPTGIASGGSQGNLQTGDGEFNQMIRTDIGRSFKVGNLPFYTSAYAGFNNRTNQFSEEVRFGAELGAGFFKEKLWANIKFNSVNSLKNGATAETVSSTSIFANNTEFNTISFQLNYYVTEKFGFSADYTEILSGEIIAAAPSYSIGVFVDL